MTPRKLALDALADAQFSHYQTRVDTTRRVSAAIAKAVAAEREACARFVEKWVVAADSRRGVVLAERPPHDEQGKVLADAIRGRKP